jgi:acyl-CoA synthetase (AMP-forming)/AMP-acid ligase II
MAVIESSEQSAPRTLPPYTPTLPQMLRHIADQYGTGEAQIRGDRRLTYRALERRSAELARGLLALGLTKGSRVGLLMPTSPEFTVFFMAAARIGAIVAPLSTLYQGPELAWVLSSADIQVLITCDRYLSHDYLARLEQTFPALDGQGFGRIALPQAPYLRSVLVWGDRGDRSWAAPIESTLQRLAAERPDIDEAMLAAVEANVTPADDLCIIHTSGSTANPKGVVHGHGPFIRHTYQMSRDFWGCGEGDRFITTRPFFWVAGLSATLFHSLHRGCCLITPEETSGATVRHLIETEGVTALSAGADVFTTLSNDPDMQAGGYDVIQVNQDCAAIAKRTEDGWAFINPKPAGRKAPEHLPSSRFASGFGMTETMGCHTSLPIEELLPPDKPYYNGRPVPGVLHRLVDAETRQPAAPGELGELLVSGYNLTKGLYKRERSETFTADGFYATGDVCRIDEEGYVSFSHRLGEMIKIHGANVAPLEVEICLMRLPQIARAAVVAVGRRSDPLLVAAVEVRPGQSFDEAEIRAELRTQLSSFKVPKRIIPLEADDFPLTGSGKVKKPILIEMIEKQIYADSPAN